MKLAIERKDSQKVSPKELQEMWENIDLSRFWGKVVRGVSEDVEAYKQARAKSREGAVHHVFL